MVCICFTEWTRKLRKALCVAVAAEAALKWNNLKLLGDLTSFQHYMYPFPPPRVHWPFIQLQCCRCIKLLC